MLAATPRSPCAVRDEPELVAQPLHHRARVEDAPLQRVRRVAVELQRDGGEQPVTRHAAACRPCARARSIPCRTSPSPRPAEMHSCPTAPACWSPTSARTIDRRAEDVGGGDAEVRRAVAHLGAASRAARGTARTARRSTACAWMSYSSVRDAFVASVACTRPPVSFQSSQESTVPASSSPRSAAARAPSTLSRIHASLVAEKYGSSSSPVRRTSSTALGSRSSSRQRSAVRRSCQTMARCTGRPVARSHTTTVSRCTAMPMPAMSPAESRAALKRLARARHRASRRSPRRRAPPSRRAGSAARMASALRDSTAPSSAKTMARVLVVPASRARTGIGSRQLRVLGTSVL